MCLWLSHWQMWGCSDHTPYGGNVTEMCIRVCWPTARWEMDVFLPAPSPPQPKAAWQLTGSRLSLSRSGRRKYLDMKYLRHDLLKAVLICLWTDLELHRAFLEDESWHSLKCVSASLLWWGHGFLFRDSVNTVQEMARFYYSPTKSCRILWAWNQSSTVLERSGFVDATVNRGILLYSGLYPKCVRNMNMKIWMQIREIHISNFKFQI